MNWILFLLVLKLWELITDNIASVINQIHTAFKRIKFLMWAITTQTIKHRHWCLFYVKHVFWSWVDYCVKYDEVWFLFVIFLSTLNKCHLLFITYILTLRKFHALFYCLYHSLNLSNLQRSTHFCIANFEQVLCNRLNTVKSVNEWAELSNKIQSNGLRETGIIYIWKHFSFIPSISFISFH